MLEMNWRPIDLSSLSFVGIVMPVQVISLDRMMNNLLNYYNNMCDTIDKHAFDNSL